MAVRGLPIWAAEAVEALERGQAVQVRPRGHSMSGRINDGDLVTLVPCSPEEPTAGDIVLVRIQGKRFSHVVLHSVLAVENGRFLIGSHQGRVDGWVDRDAVYGVIRTDTQAQAEQEEDYNADVRSPRAGKRREAHHEARY